MNPAAAAADGLVSAIVGFVIAAIVPAFLMVFYASNSPWYIPVLYLVFIAATVAVEVINQVIGSFAYAAGFLYGAYLLQDWLAFGGVLILSAFVIYLRYKDA